MVEAAQRVTAEDIGIDLHLHNGARLHLHLDRADLVVEALLHRLRPANDLVRAVLRLRPSLRTLVQGRLRSQDHVLRPGQGLRPHARQCEEINVESVHVRPFKGKFSDFSVWCVRGERIFRNTYI